MSQRIGMADGRCLTFNNSNRLLVESLMKNVGIDPPNNSEFRRILQEKGPDLITFADDRDCLRPWELAEVE